MNAMRVLICVFLILDVAHKCLGHIEPSLQDEFNKKFDELFTRVKDLEGKNVHLEKENRELRERIKYLEGGQNNLKNKQGANKRDIVDRQIEVEEHVAFFATVTPHDVENLGENQNLVFDNAVTNLGNAYHPIHGLFTAPVDGIYLFSATIAGISTRDVDYYSYLDVDGKKVANFLSHTYEQSSQVAIVQLKAGNDVSVRNTRAGEHILGSHYTSFSGVLLFETYGSTDAVIG